MKGYNNEFNFVLALNNKKVCELNPLLYDLIHELFDNINDQMIIKSWRNHYKQKTDIFVKINDMHKRLSIKMGSRNSVHLESIGTFINFLKENDIPNNAINNYLEYHYGDGTTDNSGFKRLSAENYKKHNQEKIDYINNQFSNPKLINKMIERSITKGLVLNDRIDAIICGEPTDFLWIKREDIKKIILNKKDNYCSSPHFGPLVCQPLNRCLNYNRKYEYGRNYIQIKWYSLFDDIIENMNDKVINIYSKIGN